MSETQCYYDPSRGYPRGGCYPTPIHKILNVPVSCLSHHLRSECFFLSGQHSPKYRSQKLSIDSRSHHHGLHHSFEYLLISHSMQSVSTAPSSPSLYLYSTIPIELSSFPHFLLASPSFLAILGTIAKTRIAFSFSLMILRASYFGSISKRYLYHCINWGSCRDTYQTPKYVRPSCGHSV